MTDKALLANLHEVVHVLPGGEWHTCFYTKRRWAKGEIMDVDNVVLPSGKSPQGGALVNCEKCGQNVLLADLRYKDDG